MFKEGDIVHVAARTFPGLNKLGGVGRVIKISSPEDLPKCVYYDVKYVLGGMERMVHEKYVQTSAMEAGTDKENSNKSRKERSTRGLEKAKTSDNKPEDREKITNSGYEKSEMSEKKKAKTVKTSKPVNRQVNMGSDCISAVSEAKKSAPSISHEIASNRLDQDSTLVEEKKAVSKQNDPNFASIENEGKSSTKAINVQPISNQFDSGGTYVDPKKEGKPGTKLVCEDIQCLSNIQTDQLNPTNSSQEKVLESTDNKTYIQDSSDSKHNRPRQPKRQHSIPKAGANRIENMPNAQQSGNQETSRSKLSEKCCVIEKSDGRFNGTYNTIHTFRLGEAVLNRKKQKEGTHQVFVVTGLLIDGSYMVQSNSPDGEWTRVQEKDLVAWPVTRSLSKAPAVLSSSFVETGRAKKGKAQSDPCRYNSNEDEKAHRSEGSSCTTFANTSSRYQLFCRCVAESFKASRKDILDTKALFDSVNSQLTDSLPFSKEEFDGQLTKLGQDNRIMHSDGTVFLI